MAEERQIIEEEWSEEGLDFSDEDEMEANEEIAQENTEDPGSEDLFFELADEISEEDAEAEPSDAAEAEETVEAEASVEADASSEAESSGETSAEELSEAKADRSAVTKEKKLFGKKKEKAKSQMEVKIAELEEQRVRQLAEFENFRKRSEREKSQMFEMGAKDVIEKILPVIDNFERGLMGVPEEQKEEPFVQGMELVYKQILTTFEALGVQPIEAVGKEFDPSMHNAVMAVDDDSLESGTVAEELQKGYLYKDSVVRHSMVKVVN